jgi:butyrate kinase
MQVLAINPGSTSTKIALFKNETCLWRKNIEHPEKEIQAFLSVVDQYSYRMEQIIRVLQDQDIRLATLDAIVGRGGILNPLQGGTYVVNDYMVEALRRSNTEHASNLGGILAYYLAEKVNIPAFIVDPVAVDELEPLARLSGHPELPRISLSHALNMKAVARKVAYNIGKGYQEINLIVVHLGSGISVAPHRRGRMIDVNNANDEGPFATERCGTVPATQLVKLCYSGKYTEKEIMTLLNREGGLYAYLGTKDSREVERRLDNGDEEARLVLEALCYQVAKEIGAMATVLEGEIDRIVLTGGLAHSNFITNQISRRVKFLAPIEVVPGEEEMESLALGALRVLKGEEASKFYQDEKGCTPP